MKGILISGYYGFGNSGDDALLYTIISEFKKLGLDKYITVLSSNPSETKKMYGVKAVNRINPFSILFNMIKCRLFISGGGTLIQDGTSTKSLLYYLGLIQMACLLHKKTMLYANGIGPVNKPSNREKCTKVLNKTDVITVRDKRSLDVLRDLSIDKPLIKLTADPVFLMEESEDVSRITDKIGVGEFYCVSIRPSRTMKETFKEDVSEALDRFCTENNIKAVFLPLQQRDLELSKQICSLMTTEPLLIEEKLTPKEIIALVGKSKITVGMRLHMLIYASVAKVPLVGIVYDTKVSGFMEYTGQDLFVNDSELSVDNLYELMNESIQNYDEIKLQLSDIKDKLTRLAKENVAVAESLYKSGQRGNQIEK